MTVTPAMVKELRETTGAGMGDCKKALDQAGGDMEKAVIVLRERGLAAAAKKADRAASEGVIVVGVDETTGTNYLVEVNCETDFVTRNDDFQSFVAHVQKSVVKSKATNATELNAASYEGSLTVSDATKNLVAKIGEKIEVRRVICMGGSPDTSVSHYIHAGGRVGVLVELTAEGIASKKNHAALLEIGKDVALQVAAMKPLFLEKASVSAAFLKQEEEVFYTQYRNQGKPEAALPKIIASRMETWHKENCLVDQMFVKDDTKNVSSFVEQSGKSLGLNALKVKNFVRLELGEGVDKKSVDFAAEVAAQIADVKH
jgi:elongation factor Ts